MKLVQAIRVDNFYKQKSALKYFEDSDDDRNFVKEIALAPSNPNVPVEPTPAQSRAFTPLATSTQQENISDHEATNDTQSSFIEDTDNDDDAILWFSEIKTG